VLGNGVHIRILGYADDFVLVSNTPLGLQRLIDCVHQLCTLVAMLVSYVKTKVMVFKAVGVPAQPFLCSGHPLERVDS
jgi:hypothetical protein